MRRLCCPVSLGGDPSYIIVYENVNNSPVLRTCWYCGQTIEIGSRAVSTPDYNILNHYDCEMQWRKAVQPR